MAINYVVGRSTPVTALQSNPPRRAPREMPSSSSILLRCPSRRSYVGWFLRSKSVLVQKDLPAVGLFARSFCMSTDFDRKNQPTYVDWRAVTIRNFDFMCKICTQAKKTMKEVSQTFIFLFKKIEGNKENVINYLQLNPLRMSLIQQQLLKLWAQIWQMLYWF